MKELWRKFDDLSAECYQNMIQSNLDISSWDETFLVLLEIIDMGRSRDSNFAPELYQLGETIDEEYEVVGWLEDYMDELDMYGEFDKLAQVCEKLIGLFQWIEDSDSELRWRMVSALREEGRCLDALSASLDWYKTKPDEVLAAVSLIYTRTEIEDFEGAEQIVKIYISEDTTCTEENEILYTAAEYLYKASGNKEAEKRIKQEIQKREKEAALYYAEMKAVDRNNDMLDEDLPFN